MTVQLLLGGASDSEVAGLAPARMLVIETGGTLELADTLKIALDGAPATGLAISASCSTRSPARSGSCPAEARTRWSVRLRSVARRSAASRQPPSRRLRLTRA